MGKRLGLPVAVAIAIGIGWGLLRNGSYPSFQLERQVLLAQPSQLPPCSTLISGAYDPDCVLQCGFFPWAPDYDGGLGCYAADGTHGDITVSNQSSVLSVDSVSPFYLPDGGWVPVQTYTDDTSGTGATYQVNSATMRATFGGPHTIVFTGYFSSTGPDPTGWAAMITDGTNQMQLRRGGGSNLQFLETPNVASSGGECLDNWCAIVARNWGDGGIDVRQGGNTSFITATTIGAITGTNKLFLGGGVGACCAPQGAMGGPLGPFTLYNTAKSNAWSYATDRALWGAQAVASGPGGAVGNLGVRLARYDLDKSGGGLNVLGNGDYMMDPVTGAHTNQTYHLLSPVDSLDGGTLVGSAVWRGHTDRGPLYHWKHQNTAGWLTSEDGGVAGEVLGSVQGDAGNIDTNAFFIGTALTDGGYSVTSTYWIQNVCSGGAIDGGFDHCTGSVAGGGVFARYPLDGCPMACSGATGTVESILYVGNDAGQTAGLEIGLIQMTDSLEFEPPSVTNAQVSAQYLEIDAGAVPSGCSAGKVAGVFQAEFSSSWYPAVMNSGQPPGTASYIYDISKVSGSHDLLQWVTTEGDSSKMDSLLYGSDQNYVTPNKFATGGQYPGADAGFVSRQFAATSLEWYLDNGTLPDGGTGQGARAIIRYDQCANQSAPASCAATTAVQQNTGQLGLCPGTADFFEIGTRALGTSPSTSRVHHINICSCPAARCAGDCR